MREFSTHAFLGGVLLAAFATAQEKSAQPEGYRFTVVSDTLETPVPNQ